MRRLLPILLLSFLAVGILAPIANADIPWEYAVPGLPTVIDAIDSDEEEDLTRTPPENNREARERIKEGIPIMPPYAQSAILSWYIWFAGLGVGLVFVGLVMAGWKTMAAAWNPGIRADATLAIQRAVIALILICILPSLLQVAVETNNALVVGIADQFQARCTLQDYDKWDAGADVIASLVSSIPALMIEFVERFFDMRDIQAVIFNDARNSGTFEMFTEIYKIETGNAFADIVIDIAMMFFEFYFNIFYIVRSYKFCLMFAIAPGFIWIWQMTGRTEVLHAWASVMITTIFVQCVHAAVFAITFSIFAAADGGLNGDIGLVTQSLIDVGTLLGGLGGLALAATLIYLGVRMMFATNERVIAEIKSSMVKAVSGLGVIVLAWGITSIILGAAGTVPFAAPAAPGGKADLGVITVWIALVCVLGVSRTAIKILGEAVGETAMVDLDRDTSRVAGKAGMAIYGAVRTLTSFKNNFGKAIQGSAHIIQAGADAKAGLENYWRGRSAAEAAQAVPQQPIVVTKQLPGGGGNNPIGQPLGGGNRPLAPAPAGAAATIPRTQVKNQGDAVQAVPQPPRMQPAAAVPQTEVRQPAAPAATPPRTEVRPGPAAPAASPPRTEVRQPAAPARYQPASQQLPPLPSHGAAPARPAGFQPAPHQPASGAGFVSYTGGGSTTGAGFSGFGGRPNLMERYRPGPARQRQSIDDMNNHEDLTRRSIR